MCLLHINVNVIYKISRAAVIKPDCVFHLKTFENGIFHILLISFVSSFLKILIGGVQLHLTMCGWGNKKRIFSEA